MGGDSAGGNLAAVVSQLARNDGVPLPALQLLLYPVTHFAGETRSMTLFADGYFLTKHGHGLVPRQLPVRVIRRRTTRGVRRCWPTTSPACRRRWLVTGGFDPLRDEGNQYAEALAAAGVAVDHRQYGSMVHAFANFFPLGGGSVTAMADIVSALRAHLCRT